MKYKGIIFDFFGVISSEVAPFWFEQHIPQSSMIKLKEQYVHPADRGEITEEKLFDTLAKLIATTPSRVRQEWLNLVQIDSGVVEVIKQLKKNYKIILCSNAPSFFLREILKNNQLDELFDNIIISSEVRIAKPDTKIFKKILDIVQYNPDEMIFIDDNPEHILAAQSVGIISIKFENTPQLIKSLEVVGVTAK